jgi:hypothetical protein
MIFISAEKSKQAVLANFFSNLYDGTLKDYPNEVMMFFIPLHKGETISSEKQEKIFFNHDSYTGEEAAIRIGGLNNIHAFVKQKEGVEISLRLLLKSIPTSQGMSHPQLFQFIKPNISGVVTLATFQAGD